MFLLFGWSRSFFLPFFCWLKISFDLGVLNWLSHWSTFKSTLEITPIFLEISVISGADVEFLTIEFVNDAFGKVLAISVPASWLTISINPDTTLKVSTFLEMLLRNRQSINALKYS